MSNTPGRRLTRPLLPQDPLPQVSGSSSHEQQNAPGEDKRVLADVETQENPALPKQSSTRVLADLETREIPALPKQPSTDTLANGETRESPALMVNRLSVSMLADVETRKNPALVPGPVQDKRPFSAPVAQHVAVQQTPPFAPDLSYRHDINPVPKKEKHARMSRRKKTQLVVMLTLLLLPSFLIIFELINAISVYRQMQDGIGHLQAAANIFHSSSHDGITNYFDTGKLRQARAEIDIAHDDFASLSDKLEHDGAVSLLSHLWSTQISTARALAHIATDGTAVAQQLLKMINTIGPSIVPAFQHGSGSVENAPLKPYLTQSSYQDINTTFDNIAPLIHRMTSSMQGLSLDSLPISAKQHEMIASMLPLLPVLDVDLSLWNELRDPLGWFLGIGGQRAFLIEPMDSAELRATGGFTGQFGELVLNGGHVGPLKLANIGKYEEDHTTEGSPPDPIIYPKVVGQSAPAPYVNWWPVGNFGLRDANLSADFPTSARIAMERYRYEFGRNVDGVIMFTPGLIKHVLHVTGPLSIPAYRQTINEQNLQDVLHYYQLNNVGIRQEEIVEHVEDPQVARKLFTQRVTTTLINTVTHLPLNTMLSLASEMLNSMKSRDLQIYVTNPQLEALIGKYGSTASLDRSTTHDGLFIVQSNLSASKASQYVTTTARDTIVLNEQGGATHHLQLTLDYQQKGDVYGLDTYRDYVRIYVPLGSQLLAGNGFDQTGTPYCGDIQSGYRLCQADVYGDGSLICTPPVEIGYATSYLTDPYAGRDHPLDVTGPPQNQQSDEVGRAMFGGWVVIPKNCTMNVTLTWYVPPMSKQAYSLLLQAQASVSSPLDLTVQPAAGICAPHQGNGLHSSRVINGEDIFFTVKRQGAKCSLVTQ